MSKKKNKTLKATVIDKFTTLLTAAFGFVAALAWNDAIKSLFLEDGALHSLKFSGPWIYAILVTVLAVVVTIWISKIAEKVKYLK